ncbi:MAG: hypothetical protein CMK59_10005 [Proteobacteria bacterium]|nr:hypothetical protein [Pseudomonadota bacterium]
MFSKSTHHLLRENGESLFEHSNHELLLSSYFERKEDWQEITERISPKAIQKRLDIESQTAKLDGSITRHSAWLNVVDESLDKFSLNSDPLPKGSRQVVSSLVFPELLMPFLMYTRQHTFEFFPKTFFKTAFEDLEIGLLQRLCQVSEMVLGEAFYMYRFDAPDETSEASDSLYRSFVAAVLNGGWAEILKEYPVLARIIGQLVLDWIGYMEAFFEHFTTDEALFTAFGIDGGSKVVGAKVSLSDPHDGNKSVIELTFTGQRKLIYKPRQVDTEKELYLFLQELNKIGAPVRFPNLTFLAKENYGWMEFVHHKDCQSSKDLNVYFELSGAFLCVSYILQLTDLHCENIIADGGIPYIVDAETLMHPKINPKWNEHLNMGEITIEDKWSDSVYRTGLLPEWETGLNGRSYDISALGCDKSQSTGFPVGVFDHLFSDEFSLEWQEGIVEPAQSLPVFQNKIAKSYEYKDDILKGFELMYLFFLEHKQKIFEEPEFINRFQKLNIRFIFRPTGQYIHLLSNLRHGEMMTSNIERSLHSEILTSTFWSEHHEDFKHDLWPILMSERKAVENSDVPKFHCFADSKDLWCANEMICPNFLEITPMEMIRKRVSQIDLEDLGQQRAFIEATLYAHQADANTTAMSNNHQHEAVFEHQNLTKKSLFEQAIQIGEDIQQRAFWSSSDSVNWITLITDSISGKLRLQPMGDKLYTGRMGVALFLTALEQLAGETQFSKLRDATLLPIRQKLQSVQSARNLTNIMSLGLGGGIAGIIYGLCKVASLNNDETLLDLAEHLALTVTPAVIERDKDIDLLGGSSGLIVALDVLYQKRQREEYLNTMRLCGAHLKNTSISFNEDMTCWKSSIALKPLAGFGHGNAGIVYALLRLMKRTNSLEYVELIQRGLAYERHLFNEENQNWPDLRRGRESDFMMAWCSGAPGIGLSRLALLKHQHQFEASLFDEDILLKEINSALNSAKGFNEAGPDHLCCGNLGRIAFIFEVGRILNRPELIDIALQRVSVVIQRAKDKQAFTLYASADNVLPTPGFMQGVSGIGFQMLYFAASERLPNVLMYE